jgi:hypothetical protein
MPRQLGRREERPHLLIPHRHSHFALLNLMTDDGPAGLIRRTRQAEDAETSADRAKRRGKRHDDSTAVPITYPAHHVPSALRSDRVSSTLGILDVVERVQTDPANHHSSMRALHQGLGRDRAKSRGRTPMTAPRR